MTFYAAEQLAELVDYAADAEIDFAIDPIIDDALEEADNYEASRRLAADRRFAIRQFVKKGVNYLIKPSPLALKLGGLSALAAYSYLQERYPNWKQPIPEEWGGDYESTPNLGRHIIETNFMMNHKLQKVVPG